MISLPAGTMDRLGLAPPKRKPGFFVDYRKGEVGELRLLLRKLAADYKSSSSLGGLHDGEGTAKRREILKRLIRCMTLGMDVSRLYTEVVLVSHTTDPVQKKMIYMFLSTYSKDNPDLTVLTINTLLKDVDSVDPVIRSLALRNISAFDTKLSNDYAKNAVLKKFHDPCDAVKRTAIIGGLRLYKSQCAIARLERNTDFDREHHRSEILQHLMSSLKSLNLDVMFDSMCVYSEMVDPEEDLRLSRQSIVYLLNRIKKMNEWEQCLTLKLLQTYTPVGDELFDLLNLLDDRLKHTSTAVFLGAAKCFLSWTSHDEMLQLEVIRRLQVPMIALITQSCNEIAYNLLLNALVLITNAPRVESSARDDGDGASCAAKPPFSEHYEVFFCRYDDPAYIKRVKLSILVAIACESNSLHIVNELNEYVSDTNHEIAVKSVKAVGIIALKSPSHLDLVIQQISVILGLRISYLVDAALYVIRALLRAYPHDSAKLLRIVEESRSCIKEPTALSYYIWILGEFSDSVDHAPYTLEEIIDQPDRLDVTGELLCASLKVFFKRPPEMFPALSRLFVRILNESQNPELISLAHFYYSLLSSDLDAAERIVSACNHHDCACTFTNMMVELGIPQPSADWRDSFNSLDLVDECSSKGKGSPSFFPFAYGDVDGDIFTASCPCEDSSDDGSASGAGPAGAAPLPASDGDLCLSGPEAESSLVAWLRQSLAPLGLVLPSTLLSEEYQKCWFECDHTCQSTAEVHCGDLGDLCVDSLEDILFDVHIATLASGKNQATTKLYQYAQDSSGHMYYIELVLDPSEGRFRVQVSVKSQRADRGGALVQSLSDALCHCVERWLLSVRCD